MSKKLISFLSILILISACSINSNSQEINTPDIPTPTLQESYLDLWKAAADFGTFTFILNLSTRMGIMGKFDFPNGFSCGTSEVSGISHEVFVITTTFPLLAQVSKRDPLATVTFPFDEAGFTVGPFWVTGATPDSEERLPVLTMALVGQFDSGREVSGEYTAYFVKSPENTELQSTPCSGKFTATLTLP